MTLFWAIVLAIAGIGLVLFFSEQLVKGVVGASLNFKVSAFLISVIFLGFDPENLGVGATGSYESLNGLATGSIIGAAMVAMALALGISAVFAPLKFEKIPMRILLIPVLSLVLFAILSLDKTLSRPDGAILLASYIFIVIYLVYLNKKGYHIKSGGEVAETLEKEKLPGKWKSAGLILASLVAIAGGSELLVHGSKSILQELNLSDTYYGMVIIAFLISIEEIARELPAALKGKSDITIGNVVGSVLAFFLFNAGIIALISPVSIAGKVIWFFLPVSFGTILFIVIVMAVTNKISRWAGAVLLLFYVVFIVAGYFL